MASNETMKGAEDIFMEMSQCTPKEIEAMDRSGFSFFEYLNIGVLVHLLPPQKIFFKRQLRRCNGTQQICFGAVNIKPDRLW